MNKRYLIGSFLLVLLGTIFSCVKENDFDANPTITFSKQELLFDTVFTSIGTTTKQLIVYNRGNKPIQISSIRVCGAKVSPFRINVDGDTSLIIQNIEIQAKDSLYIFATATINPNSETNPFLVEDSIEFAFGNKRQYYSLVAFGQNAIYHFPNQKKKLPNGTDIEFSYANCFQPWSNTLPHIVYGNCLVDKDSILTIEAGTKIYFYNKSTLLVSEGGCLKAKGQHLSPIIFQSMRLDAHYKDLPGQWNGLYFMPGSINNEMKWAVIRNGTIGIDVDSCANDNPTIIVENTIIENMSHAAIYAKAARIEMKSSLITNCQNYLLAITSGGNYSFMQCTFANYWKYASRYTPSIYITDKDENSSSEEYLLSNAEFGNCIVYGALDEEIKIDLKDISKPNYRFNYCLLKTSLPQSISNFNECIIGLEPKFLNTQKNDYHLDTYSPAIDKGYPPYATLCPNDLDKNPRKYTPSIGAYEYVEARK